MSESRKARMERDRYRIVPEPWTLATSGPSSRGKVRTG